MSAFFAISCEPPLIRGFLVKGYITNNLLKTDNYNPYHDILDPYNILVQVRFATSKTELEI